MSWLDDMEAANPAHPSPDTDPRAAPDYVPDTSRGIPVGLAWEVGRALSEQARQQNATVQAPPDRPWLILDSDGDLLGDYRSKADRDHALVEHVTAGEPVSSSHWDPDSGYGPGWSDPQPLPLTTTGPDWRALREAETQARDAGLRATVPQPDRRGTPEYEADAAAWGTGRGVAPDGLEAG